MVIRLGLKRKTCGSVYAPSKSDSNPSVPNQIGAKEVVPADRANNSKVYPMFHAGFNTRGALLLADLYRTKSRAYGINGVVTSMPSTDSNRT
jgi:hypothetical protein